MFEIIDHLAVQALSSLDDEELENLPEEKHPYHRFLYLLVKEFNIKSALEIGTWHGVGALHMTKAGAQTAAIDINTPKYADRFHFVLGDSTTIPIYDKVIKHVEKHGKLGLVFQDSSHHYWPSRWEWKLYSGLCGKSAIWICDDIDEAFHDPNTDPPGKGMVQYFDEIPCENKKLYNRLHLGNKIGVVLL